MIIPDDRRTVARSERTEQHNQPGATIALEAAARVVLLVFLIFQFARPQTNPNFDVRLRLDVASAEESIDLFEERYVSTQELAGLRGNRIAASTAGLIANKASGGLQLQDYLDSLKYHESIRYDFLHLQEGKRNVSAIKELLKKLKVENFSQRVAATVEQIFPQNASISLTIPVYAVAIGHENVDAFVRRIVWTGDIPRFVGENEGELTIVLNLAHAVGYGKTLDERFVTLLGVTAHEVFHAAFGAFKQNSPLWKKFYDKYNRPFDRLADLTQNEGIAYYLSLDQLGHGYLPPDWYPRTRQVFSTFNAKGRELLADSLSPARAAELIRTANLSGYWESYGAMAGMMMAREIDLHLGRAAMIETISLGPEDFFRKYIRVTHEDSNLPSLDGIIAAQFDSN